MFAVIYETKKGKGVGWSVPFFQIIFLFFFKSFFDTEQKQFQSHVNTKVPIIMYKLISSAYRTRRDSAESLYDTYSTASNCY